MHKTAMTLVTPMPMELVALEFMLLAANHLPLTTAL